MHRYAGIAGVSLCLWLTSACKTSCGEQQYLKYVDGTTRTLDGQQIYESTPFNGEWLHFPGNRTFELVHADFHTTDISSLTMYVAFSSRPLSGDAGDIALASGDVAVVEKITNTSLVVHNDTCSEQYLYVKIAAPLAEPDASASP